MTPPGWCIPGVAIDQDGAVATKYWQTAAECVATGFPSPGEIYHPGEPAAGSITGKVAGNVLSPVGTPLYQQAFDGPQLGAGFDYNQHDSFDAANSGVHDYNNEAFAMLIAWKMGLVFAGVRELFGKYSGKGYMQFASQTAHVFQSYDGSTNRLPTVPHPKDVNLHYLLCGVSQTQTQVWLYGDIGEDDDNGDLNDMTNPALFSLGAHLHAAAGYTLGFVTIWTGAAAETIYTDRATLGPAWWAM